MTYNVFSGTLNPTQSFNQPGNFNWWNDNNSIQS